MSDHGILLPTKKRQGFDGGKNNKFEKHLILDNESPDCLNVIFENGAAETRPGSTKFNTASVGTFSGDGLYTRTDRSGAQSMCAWWGGTLYVASGTSFFSIPSSSSIFTAGVRVGATEYENYIFFGNGTTAYKYNGAFTRHGVPAPTGTMTVASTAAGTLTGGYVYKVTYVNSALVESDLGAASAIITAASAQVTVGSIPTAPVSFGVGERRLYRASGSTASTFFRVTTLANNTATTFVDNLGPGELGAEAPTDQGMPPKYSFIITHQNRLWCNDLDNPGWVWYSNIDANGPNPYGFGSENFFIIGEDGGDLVRGLDIHDNSILVRTDKGCTVIYLTDPSDTSTWRPVKLRSPYGSKSPFGSWSYENKVMFPALQNTKLVGYAAISGDAVDPEATLLTVSAAGSDLKSDRIEPDMFLIQETYTPRISSIVYQNKAYTSVTYGDSQTTNNRIYVFDFSISNLSKKQEFSWTPWTGLNAEQFTIYGGKLYYQSSEATGFVHEMLKAGQYNDDGAAINSYLWTKEFSGLDGDEQNHKDFRYTNILYEQAGAYPMDLTYRVDSDLGDGNTIAIDLDPGGSLWGTMVWGLDNWGGGAENGENRIYLGQLSGKRVQFKYSNQNTAGQKFKIIGMQYSYNRKGRR